MGGYKNKLDRFIGSQCYLLGAYSGRYDESCGQVADNIKKYGLWHIFACYWHNSGLTYLGKDETLKGVFKRIFSELLK